MIKTKKGVVGSIITQDDVESILFANEVVAQV